MKAVILVAVLLSGCASSQPVPSEPAVRLGVAVAESRSIPPGFLAHTQLDRVPEVLPHFGDRFDDRVSTILRSTGPQRVIAVLLVSEEGRVLDVIIRKADFTFFADEVRTAAKNFRFRPATYLGKPARWFVEQPFEFK